ncbi:hypothetical protein SAMN05421853_102246 [Roseivivax halotolerans]|jgi:hypothetical protein|uniref:Cytochrome C oxidase assembly protein n=1 Tax=Roseivivax halotolerans TaxID=93684 RepID=A0A1I5WD13_9RHOB|nr:MULTISPECIES: hypothetical protein [Roseivivax]QFT64138.1 hypothetical protein FIU91_14460 [Roseivivax sp. THAF30]SFQ17216.1 hypothetical protein SAMN05421853_102246 [Roseivivax halotolerans]
MSLIRKHEMHERRFSRNLGVGLTLTALIAIIFGLTMVKVTNDDFSLSGSGVPTQTEEAN